MHLLDPVVRETGHQRAVPPARVATGRPQAAVRQVISTGHRKAHYLVSTARCQQAQPVHRA